MSRTHISKVLPVLALVIFAGKMQAVTLTGPTAVTLTCDTVIGPIPTTVGITLASAGALNVTVSDASSALVALPSPATISVTSTTVPTLFTVSAPAGCKGLVPGVPPSPAVVLTFTPSAGTAITVAVNYTVTNSGSALAPSPTPVTLTCTRTAGVDAAVGTQTVNVTSPANLGTPFYVDQTTVPSTIFGITGGGTSGAPVTASATPVALTLTLVSGCGSLLSGSTTYTIHLLTNAPVTTANLTVTVQIGASATLTPTPTSISLSYVKGSGTYTPVTSSVAATPAVFFSVDPTSLPIWMNVTPTTGATGSPVVLSFVPTAGAQTLALGSYSASVRLLVSGYLNLSIPVTLVVSNPAATISAAEGITRTLSWTINTALPTLKITPVSSDSPIAYTVTTSAGSLSPQVSATSGLAYNFGTPISVTFLNSVFAAAAPGAALTGTVTITPASGSPVVVTITVNVAAAAALISGLSPSALPTATTGSYTVIVAGSGFAATGGSLVVTKAGIVSGGIIVSDFNVVPTVNNSGSITLVITVPASTDPLLPFSGNGGPVLIGVCNPQGVGCSTPTSTLSLAIGVNPLIQAVTSSSSYIQATSPALTAVAPYDILSIFGTNFCVSGGTGCVSPPILYGVTDPTTVRYPLSVSPDAVSGTQRVLSVAFLAHGSSNVIGTAPVLFANNSQINVLVPDAVSAYLTDTVDIVVTFGYGASGSATLLKSAPYAVTVVASNPGIFTVGGDGQGAAAALLPNFSLVTNTNWASATSVATDSPIVALYVTGLGKPDSDDATGTYSATCMAVGSYFPLVNSQAGSSLTSDDGLVIQSALFPASTIQPCIKSTSGTLLPSVTIGGQPAALKFAGWVADSVAGLYQINVQLPASGSGMTDASGSSAALVSTLRQMPVVITTPDGRSSQPSGVTLAVERNLGWTLPTHLTGASGTLWPVGATTTIVAIDGTSTYTYASSSTFPAGLTFHADGTITGTPTTPGTTTVTVTAVDSGSPVITGSVTFTFIIT